LEVEWQEALRQVRAPDAPGAVDRLADGEQAQLHAHVAYIADYLDKNALVSYRASALAETKQLLGKSIANPKLEDKEIGGLQSADSLRDVLNAAWVYRVEQLAPTEQIQAAADRLWNVIADKRRRPED